MNNSSDLRTQAGTNLERKKTWVGLAHDVSTLMYCMVFIPMCCIAITNNTNPFGPILDALSYIYFITTGIINMYHHEYAFVFHHIACISMVWANNYNDNNYSLWLATCYFAEVSNIFLSMKNVLKHIKKYIKINPLIEQINNVMFILAYFAIRIFYLIPLTTKFMFEHISDLNYKYLIAINVFIMCALNLYWGYLILLKVIKIWNVKKSD